MAGEVVEESTRGERSSKARTGVEESSQGGERFRGGDDRRRVHQHTRGASWKREVAGSLVERREGSPRGSGVTETHERRPGEHVAIEIDAARRLMDLVDVFAFFDDGLSVEAPEDPRNGQATATEVVGEGVLDAELIGCANRTVVTLHEHRVVADAYERRSRHGSRTVPDDVDLRALPRPVRRLI